MNVVSSMGGCRCSYKSCRNTTKTSHNIHFFHYPVKQKERCKAWINRACKPGFFDLDEYQLRNKVVCEVHFADNCFLNAEKKRLLAQAIPTLDGDFLYDEPAPAFIHSNIDKSKPNLNSPKMEDIQVLPANDDGTVFVLDTYPSFKVNKEVKSYILNDNALFPIEKKDYGLPRIKQEPEFHDQEEFILGDNNEFSVLQNSSTPLKKLPPPPLKQGKPNYEILNISDSAPRVPSPTKAMNTEALESLICKTIETKYLHKLKQHTKDLNQIKKTLKMNRQKKNCLNKHSVLRYLKLRLPSSLHTLVSLSLNDEYELNEDDENFFKNLHDSSSKTYQFLSDDCGWRMPIIEIHEGDPEMVEEN